jgi:hypothetical protein
MIKLDIIKDSDTYAEALNISFDDWVSIKDKILIDIKEISRREDSMNSMNIMRELCEKYAENVTEVAVIAMIIGEAYICLNPNPMKILELRNHIHDL